MKRKSWKKTAALVTSIAMATSMMPAELSGVLVQALDSAIVTDADGSALTKTSFGVGDYFEANAVFNLPDFGGDKIKLRYNGDTSIPVTQIKYTTTDEEGEPLVNGGKNVANLYMNGALYIQNVAINEKFIAVKSVIPATTNYTDRDPDTNYTIVELELKDYAPAYQINYGFGSDIKSISYTSSDGKLNNLDASIVGSTNSVYAKGKTTVTIVSSVLLQAAEKSMTPYLTGEPGNYVYTFNALETLNITPVEKTISVSDNVQIDDEKIISINGEEKNIGGGSATDALKVGSEVTIVANHMFNIPKAAIVSLKSDGSFETEDVESAYSNGQWSATFNFSGDADAVLSFVKHVHNLSYSKRNKVNELFATCSNGDLTNETAAKIWTQVENTDPEAAPTEIDNNGVVHYADDASLNFKWDKNLLGTSGTSGQNVLEEDDKNLIAKATLKKGDDDYTIRVYNEAGGRNNVKITKTTVNNGEIETENITAYKFTGVVLSTTEGNFVSSDVKLGALGGLVEITPTSIKVNKEYAALAGEFEATLTVWTTKVTAAAEVLTYKYKTEPSDQIQEDDVKMWAAYTGKLTTSYTGAAAPDETTTAKPVADFVKYYNTCKAAYEANPDGAGTLDAYTNSMTLLYDKVKNNALPSTKKNGVFEISATEKGISDNDNVTAVFRVRNTAVENEADPDAYFVQDTDYVLAGSSVSKNIDPENPQTMEVKIINPNYKDDVFNVKWKLVTPAVVNGLSFTHGTALGLGLDDKGAVGLTSTADSFETNVKNELVVTGDVVHDDVEYWYSFNPPTNDYDLDGMFEGFPDQADLTVDKDVYMFAYYGELRAPGFLRVKVTAADPDEDHRVAVVPQLNKTTFTYGEGIEPTDVTFTAANGATGVTAANVGFKAVGKIEDNGEITATGYTGSWTNLKNLAPGRYRVQAVNTLAKNNTIENANCFTFDGNNYKVTETTFDITIEKRSLEFSMVDDIIKEKGNKPSVSINNDDVTEATTGINNDGLKLRLTGIGKNTENKAGGYTAEVTATDDYYNPPVGSSAPAILGNDGSIKYSDLYTGTLNIKWFIVNNLSEMNFNVECNDEMANIYKDNGVVSLHVEANMLIGGVAANKTTKKDTVKYGFVYAKSVDDNSIDKDESLNTVRSILRLENGFGSTNNVKKNSDGCVTGINMPVSSIEDYVWVRPYATVNGGAPVYGEPVMYCFEDVAQDVVKPELQPVELVNRRDSKGKETLYYWVYATKADRVDNTDNTNILRTAEPDKWGVVISRKGNYADPATATEKAFDYESLTLENNDAASIAQDGANYNKFESGTLLRIVDSRSRVYVRTYADFGNGLVVYSKLTPAADDGSEADKIAKYNAALETVSSDSVSEQLCTAFGIGVKAAEKIEGTTKRVRMTLERSNFEAGGQAGDKINKKDDFTTKAGKVQKFADIVLDNKDDSQNNLSAIGLVIDRNGAYDPAQHQLTAEENLFRVLRRTEGINTNTDIGEDYDVNKFEFTAVTTPADNVKVTVRGFVDYKNIRIYTDTAEKSVDNRVNP